MTLLQDLTVAVESIEDSSTSIATSAQAQSDVISDGINDFVTTPFGDIRSLSNAINIISQTNSTGAWVTSTVYNLKDLVVESGVIYLCTLPHTSGVFATDLAAARWGVYQPPDVLPYYDKKRFTTGADGIPSGGAFDRQFEIEGANDYIWPKSLLLNAVRLRVNFVGSASSPSTITLQIKEGSTPFTVLWEQTGILVFNPGANQEEHNFFNFDLNAANSISLDLSTQNLNSINGEQPANNWELIGAMTSGLGTLYIRDFEFQWLKN